MTEQKPGENPAEFGRGNQRQKGRENTFTSAVRAIMVLPELVPAQPPLSVRLCSLQGHKYLSK